MTVLIRFCPQFLCANDSSPSSDIDNNKEWQNPNQKLVRLVL